VTGGFARFARRLLNAVWPDRRGGGNADARLEREIASHLQLLEDDYRSRGLSEDEARRAARLALGGVEQTKELHRDARSFRWIDDLRRDVRHAGRLLRRTPIFSFTAVFSLAIGIGATTTIFTVVNAILFQPPAAVVAPDRLVDIGRTRQRNGFGPSSYPGYLDLRQRTTTLDGVYAYSRFTQPMSLGTGGNAGAEGVSGTIVTANYFTVLGAVPAAGRLFTAADGERPLASVTSPVVVLSHRFWTRRFDRDPSIVGREVTLNGHAFTVIGVASEGFHGTGIRALDVWVPMNMVAAVTSPGTTALTDRTANWLSIGGRLKSGISVSQAAAEIDVIGRALASEAPEENRDAGLRLTESSPVPGNGGPLVAFLALLMVIVSFVLIVACTNVAGILLARAAARRHEMALRLAIGAGRGRLVRQLLTETVLLFAIGGSAGLLLARAMTSVLISRLPSLPFPVDVSLALDGRVIAFATGVSLVAALVSGLAPALYASRTDVLPGLRNDTGLVGRLRLRHAFVVGQVALSLVLVVGGGLCLRALQRAASIDPGFDAHGVELASIELEHSGFTSATGSLFARTLVERIRQLPEVESAAIASAVPGGFEVRREAVSVPGVAPPDGNSFIVDWNVVTPGYFATLRTPLAAGRDFTNADRDGAPRVAIVSEAAARQFWPGQEAIGKYLLQQTPGPRGPANRTKPMVPLLVVGVAREVQSTSLLDGLSRAAVYAPLDQQYVSRLTIAARTTRGRRIADQLRAIVAAMNPNISIASAQTLDDAVALGLTPQRIVAAVSGVLGIVGLTLAAIGIYGVTAYAVTRRTREIGVRIALGARTTDVMAMVLREGLALTLIGAALGLLLAAAVGQVLASHLFGIPPIDPVTFTAATLLFVAIGLAACYTPVRRAAHIDPTQALRYE
jgi:predicted permease